jgi:Na+/H+-dicarboxylate symporter
MTSFVVVLLPCLLFARVMSYIQIQSIDLSPAPFQRYNDHLACAIAFVDSSSVSLLPLLMKDC